MARKYIDNLGIPFENTPNGWCSNDNDEREEEWKKQREEYGFDERETWSLNYTMNLLLYERLCMFKEINIIDTDFHKFEFKGKTITLGECIDRMIEGLKIKLLEDDNIYLKKDKEKIEKAEEVYQIYALCEQCLWW